MQTTYRVFLLLLCFLYSRTPKRNTVKLLCNNKEVTYRIISPQGKAAWYFPHFRKRLYSIVQSRTETGSYKKKTSLFPFVMFKFPFSIKIQQWLYLLGLGGRWRAKVRGSIKEIAEWVGEDGFKRNDQKCPSVKLLLFLSSSFNLENKGHDDGTRVKTTLSYKIHGVLSSTADVGKAGEGPYCIHIKPLDIVCLFFTYRLPFTSSIPSNSPH